MIVVMKVGTPEPEITRVSDELATWGLTPEKNRWTTQSCNWFSGRNCFPKS